MHCVFSIACVWNMLSFSTLTWVTICCVGDGRLSVMTVRAALRNFCRRCVPIWTRLFVCRYYARLVNRWGTFHGLKAHLGSVAFETDIVGSIPTASCILISWIFSVQDASRLRSNTSVTKLSRTGSSLSISQDAQFGSTLSARNLFHMIYAKVILP